MFAQPHGSKRSGIEPTTSEIDKKKKLGMKRHKKNLGKCIFPKFAAYRNLIGYAESYLHITGWMESIKRGYPCKPDGTELPWINYPAIAFLEQRLNRSLTMFEYGCGFSTLFYARLIKKVTSVEHNKIWYERIRTQTPPNVTVLHRAIDEDGQYCRSISNTPESYDIIVVDGKDRVNCIRQSINRLSDQGVLLLDDSKRLIYAEGFQLMYDNGFRSLDFEGLKPTGLISNRTTVFYRNENCLGI